MGTLNEYCYGQLFFIIKVKIRSNKNRSNIFRLKRKERILIFNSETSKIISMFLNLKHKKYDVSKFEK